jgi:conjugal transfer pilus assembly protein TraE
MERRLSDQETLVLQSQYKSTKKYLNWMIVSNVILAGVMAFNINRERIVISPQVAPEFKMWVEKSQVSNEYLVAMSRNVLDLLLDITPSTVSAQSQALLNMVAPKYQAALKSKLDDIAEQLTKNNLSQNFYIQSIRIRKGKPIVYITGTLNQYIDKNSASETTQIYKLTFTVSNYNVQLENIETLEPNDPQLRDQNA